VQSAGRWNRVPRRLGSPRPCVANFVDGTETDAMLASNRSRRVALETAMPCPTISVQGLSKQFGPQTAVAGVTFDVLPGEIVGLIGPNGAGKTTILRILTGVLLPSAGSATVCGFDVTSHPIEVKRRVGLAPDSDAMFESLTGFEFMEMVATLYGVSAALAHDRIYRMGDLFGLDKHTLDERFLGTYSKGMRRKVTIASTLLHNPPVVFFDEPLDGLDPNAAIAFKALLRTLAGEGKTIIYSSHLLDIVERICDRVMILDRGVMVMDGRPGELMSIHKSATLEKLFTQLTGHGSIEGKVAALARSLSDGEGIESGR
jgi:ABC-2 type transport system ATP-binding protein